MTRVVLWVAAAAWPDVEAQVAAAVADVSDRDGLGLEPRERSTLVGYMRGLEVALAAWADVRAAQADAADRAAEEAAARMRHLERLRAGVTP